MMQEETFWEIINAIAPESIPVDISRIPCSRIENTFMDDFKLTYKYSKETGVEFAFVILYFKNFDFLTRSRIISGLRKKLRLPPPVASHRNRIGVYHTHPRGAYLPTWTDLKNAAKAGDTVMAICSVRLETVGVYYLDKEKREELYREASTKPRHTRAEFEVFQEYLLDYCYLSIEA